jgi:hypothetical protein
MGLGPGFLTDLIEMKRGGRLTRGLKIMEIGAQQLADSLLQANDLLDDLYAIFAKPRPDLGVPSGGSVLSDNAPSSRVFWKSLGFEYAALDFDGHRDSVAIDLNHDPVPQAFKNSFDLVVNTGTTEHIANQDNCFRVIHDLACKGGVMYHELPAGMTDHGLINYNPRFFWKLRDANDYEVLSMKLLSAGTVPVPDHIIENNKRYDEGARLDVTALPAFAIRIAFRKRNRQPFASPLDLPDALMPGKLATLTTVAKRSIPWR